MPSLHSVLCGGCLQVHFSTDFGSTFTNTLAKGAVTMDWGVPAIHGKETVFWTQKRPNGTHLTKVKGGLLSDSMVARERY
jgi:hypothetical protein